MSLRRSRLVLQRMGTRTRTRPRPPLMSTAPHWSVPPVRSVSTLSSWMEYFSKKVPKGFEDFFPDGMPGKKEQTKEGSAADTSGKVHSKEEDGSKKGDDQKQGKTEPPFSDDNANLPGLVALLMLILSIRQYMEAEEKAMGEEITFVDFRNKFLNAGAVEKLVVINHRIAQVVLKPNAVPLHSSMTTADGMVSADNSFGGEQQQQQPSEVFTMNDAPSSIPVSTQQQQQRNKHYFYIGSVESLEEKLTKAQADVPPEKWTEVQYINRTNWGLELLKMVPFVAFTAAIYFGSRGITGAAGRGGKGSGSSIFSIGKSNAKKIKQEDVDVKFGDVAGCDEAKREIMEFVDFLKESERFTKLGAKIPKGALLCGPPGTGKTLLAKATAGEAGVPFYTISGSDFIEMFVGVGPSRVRDLFKEARSNAPCIVFIDEIDAVGRQRGRGGFSGGNDERENTLNQLLVEMDGFTPTTGIVVLAGTNRVDILDNALTRPGRFDRQIQVDKPDLKGRKDIFKVHLRGIKLDGESEDYAGRLAGLTPGFAGADIANICNEAAIVAARRKGTSVIMEDFEKATDRVIGGLESHKLLSKEERSIVAHHEAGHAMAGWFLEHADPLLKVTIIPRSSGALGFAQYLPKEVFLRSQDQIMDIVCMALAGRAAEEVFFGRVTTGAADDLRRVTQLVYSTIRDFGMNDKVGQLAFPQENQQQMGDKPYSDSTAEAMDDEARSIVDAAYARTIQLIREKKKETEMVAKLLLEKETITHDDIVDLVGPRPSANDPAYQDYISSRHKTKEASKKETTKPDECQELDLTPGLA